MKWEKSLNLLMGFLLLQCFVPMVLIRKVILAPLTKSTIFIYLCLYPYIYVLIIVRISFITGECREVSTPATRYAADSDMTIT